MLVKLNKDSNRQRRFLRPSYTGTRKMLVNCVPLISFSALHVFTSEAFQLGKPHVPVGELIRKLDDLGDGLRVPFCDAAHVQLAVALLLHLGDHPLERGAPPDGQEHLGRDPVCNALQAFFHKSFSLER